VDSAGDTVTYTVNPDGSHVRPLFTVDFSGSPHWSPDGSEVAILSAAGMPCCTVSAVIVNPDTGGYRVLPMQEPDTLFTSCVVWSADGSRLACEGQGQSDPSLNGIYTIRASDGGDLERVTSIPGGDDIPIDYSPDGKQIVFSRSNPVGSQPCAAKNSALFVVNVDGTGLRQITPGGFCDDDGSWSPDGKEIAFATTSSVTCPPTPSPPTRVGCRLGGKLFVVHPDGTGLTKVPLGTRAFAGDVSWSPDGTKIAFLLSTPVASPSGGPSSNFQEGIATANANGSDVQQVTTSPTFDQKTDWGPHPLIAP
jgi:Tol biopolymer transport system component